MRFNLFYAYMCLLAQEKQSKHQSCVMSFLHTRKAFGREWRTPLQIYNYGPLKPDTEGVEWTKEGSTPHR